MSIELIGGLVALILALIGGGVGWSQIKKHGAVEGDKERAEEDRDAAEKRLDEVHRPDLDPDQHDDFIDRL